MLVQVRRKYPFLSLALCCRLSELDLDVLASPLLVIPTPTRPRTPPELERTSFVVHTILLNAKRRRDRDLPYTERPPLRLRELHISTDNRFPGSSLCVQGKDTKTQSKCQISLFNVSKLRIVNTNQPPFQNYLFKKSKTYN